MRKAIGIGAILLLAIAGAGAVTHRARIEIVYQPQPNGDFRLYLFGQDRALVCEEKDIKIVSQGDGVEPLVIECRH